MLTTPSLAALRPPGLCPHVGSIDARLGEVTAAGARRMGDALVQRHVLGVPQDAERVAPGKGLQSGPVVCLPSIFGKKMTWNCLFVAPWKPPLRNGFFCLATGKNIFPSFFQYFEMLKKAKLKRAQEYPEWTVSSCLCLCARGLVLALVFISPRHSAPPSCKF